MQIAVLQKDGEWRIFRDGSALGSGITRSAALELAHALKFQAEEQGADVEFVEHEPSGGLKTRYSGE
jgi:hypothetical protein